MTFLYFRDLPNTDVENGAPDASVTIYYAPSADAPLEFIGQTHASNNNRNPDWAQIYSVPDSGDKGQVIRLL